jgi:hypothetical protein
VGTTLVRAVTVRERGRATRILEARYDPRDVCLPRLYPLIQEATLEP